MNIRDRYSNIKWSAVILWSAVLGCGWVLAERSAFSEDSLQWAWMTGSKSVKQPGAYGARLVPDAANSPGAREDAASWTGPSGALWLFGGLAYDSASALGRINDLWKYSPATGIWTWMKGSSMLNQDGVYGTKGVAADANTPGARNRPVSWTDPSGALWLFGGWGRNGIGSAGSLNDLWKYDRSTNQWTWMKGSSADTQSGIYGTKGVPAEANTPGSRKGGVSWTDASGALWLFGGDGYDKNNDQGDLNDLWKYDPATGNWTWMSGADTIGQAGVYGTKGTPNAANSPGGRLWSASWTDAAGALWLFGGYGRDSLNKEDDLNDLWRYEPATNNWTWVKGSSAGGEHGTYGTLGTAAADNTPGARFSPVAATDAGGGLWLFGGYGWDSDIQTGKLNDLWKFDPKTGNWVWMKGPDTTDTWGTYGAIGTPAPGNLPGCRSAGVAWADAAGGLWLFGGNGRDAYQSGYFQLNDLWRMGLPDTAAPTGTIFINGNKSVTNNANVTLSLTWADKGGSGAVRMKFCNDGAVWIPWEPLAAAKAWSLPAGDGYKTVRAMFRDAAGNNSIVYSDYIRLDTTPPTGSIIINNGASSTKNRTVSLGLTWSDGTGSGVTRMRFSLDGATWSAWEPQKTPKSYTLPAPLGYYTVRVQFLDAGNNYSAVYKDYIKLVAP